MREGAEGKGERENTDLCWVFAVYARGRLLTVDMRFFSLVACWAWCLNERTLNRRRGEKIRGERTCMDNF
jgi:hypothetical protein